MTMDELQPRDDAYLGTDEQDPSEKVLSAFDIYNSSNLGGVQATTTIRINNHPHNILC